MRPNIPLLLLKEIVTIACQRRAQMMGLAAAFHSDGTRETARIFYLREHWIVAVAQMAHSDTLEIVIRKSMCK